MTLKRIVFVGLTLIFTMASSAGAAGLEGVYAGVKGSYSDHKISDPTIKYPGSEWGFNDENDWAVGYGLAIGYDLNKRFSLPLRIEVEYLIRDDAELSWSGNEGVFISGQFDWELKAETQVDTLLVNLFYEFKNSTAWTPFVSAGVGMSFIDWKSSYTDTIGTPGISADDNVTDFAWTIGLGCSYQATNALVFDFGYRYLDAGTAEADYFELTAEADIKLHEVILGFRYAF